MPTPAKRTAPVAAKHAASQSEKAEKSAASHSSAQSAGAGAKPFLRFYHSKALRAKTLGVLETVETAETPRDHAGPLTELILELTDCGMDQYFLQSLKAAKASFLLQQSAALGLSGVQKVMGTVIRNIIGRMDDRQLLSICGSIRQFTA